MIVRRCIDCVCFILLTKNVKVAVLDVIDAFTCLSVLALRLNRNVLSFLVQITRTSRKQYLSSFSIFLINRLHSLKCLPTLPPQPSSSSLSSSSARNVIITKRKHDDSDVKVARYIGSHWCTDTLYHKSDIGLTARNLRGKSWLSLCRQICARRWASLSFWRCFKEKVEETISSM